MSIPRTRDFRHGLIGHAFAVMIEALPPIIIFKVAFQAMEDTGQVLGLLSVIERHQF